MHISGLLADLMNQKPVTEADFAALTGRILLILPDQDILTALYGDKVKLADTMRFNLSDRILAFYNADRSHDKVDVDWVRRNSVVIHYCGKNKPWNPDYTGSLGVFYRELMEKGYQYRGEHGQSAAETTDGFS